MMVFLLDTFKKVNAKVQKHKNRGPANENPGFVQTYLFKNLGPDPGF